jgi:hypothetical protein
MTRRITWYDCIDLGAKQIPLTYICSKIHLPSDHTDHGSHQTILHFDMDYCWQLGIIVPVYATIQYIVALYENEK